MRTIEQIFELDNELFKVFEQNLQLIAQLNKDSKIPKTGNVLLLFITKTNFIKEGIFELYKSENLYGINILFRSLIEHFLKFQYIFLRILKDKNDNIGEEYLDFCSLSEDIDIGKAWNNVAKMLEYNSGLDPYDVLKEINKEYEKYSKSEIIEKSNQFRYKEIIRYINKNINKDLKFESNSFILKMIPVYSDLSSFVHGGPNADKIMMEFVDKKDFDEELLNKVDLAFSLTGSIKLFSFLVYYQYDKKFNKGYLEIDKIMKKNSE